MDFPFVIIIELSGKKLICNQKFKNPIKLFQNFIWLETKQWIDNRFVNAYLINLMIAKNLADFEGINAEDIGI